MALSNVRDADTKLLVPNLPDDMDESHDDSEISEDGIRSTSTHFRPLRAVGPPLAAGLLVLAGVLYAKGWASPGRAAAGDAQMQLFVNEPCNDDSDAIKPGLRGQNPCTVNAKLESQVSEGSISGQTCSWRLEDCSATRCCKDAGMQCYEQGPSWAECKPTCAQAPDPVHWDGKNWTCKELGQRTPGEAPACSAPGADCSKSQCCATAGMQCYEKTGGWATCKVNCTTGMDLTDSNADPWTCRKLGPRALEAASWVASQCSASGKDCRETMCCSAPGEQCYVRDKFWASCKAKCTPGVDASEPWSQKKWSCDKLGTRTPVSAASQPDAKVADWVATVCSASGESCKNTKCCREAGMQCFEKDNTVAQCKSECSPGPDLFDVNGKPWSCKALGPRTPGSPKPSPPPKVSPWVATQCAKDGEGCMESRCCADVGKQCYGKNAGWAACISECTPGENRSLYGDTDAEPWSCNALGMRTPRAWGHPSLFCFSVMRTVGYEGDLMRDQIAKSAGIFACDEYAVFSNEPYKGAATTWWHPEQDDKVEVPLVSMYLGNGPLGPVHTIPFKPTYVGMSMDHTAGNTELFLRVWAMVKETGKYLTTDWTLKVDPDAVLLPSRLRTQLQPHNGLNTYIVNCNKPGMAPMMFGSVEMFSREAIVTFYEKKDQCLGSLGWKAWGEDYFMGKCLDMLGVKRTNQFDMVSDGVCKGVDCSNPLAGAFHPKKDSASWMACLAQAQAR